MSGNKSKISEDVRIVVLCAPTRVRKGRNAGGFVSRCVVASTRK